MLMFSAFISEQDKSWFFISFPFDEKKRNKEKSIQNNAYALIAYTPPIGRHPRAAEALAEAQGLPTAMRCFDLPTLLT